MPGPNYLNPPVRPNVGTAAVISGSLAANSVISGTVGSGAVFGQPGGGVFVIASGTIGTNEIGSGAVVSGRVASGIIGFGHLANASVQSGSLISGQIFGMHLASGAARSGHAGSDFLAPQANLVFSESFLTAEIISGTRAVCVTSGEALVIAQTGSGLRYPAIGVNASGVLSGVACRVIMLGRLLTDDTADWSGQVGKVLYASQSGFRLTSTKPISGIQRIGIALSGGLIVNPDLAATSGSM